LGDLMGKCGIGCLSVTLRRRMSLSRGSGARGAVLFPSTTIGDVLPGSAPMELTSPPPYQLGACWGGYLGKWDGTPETACARNHDGAAPFAVPAGHAAARHPLTGQTRRIDARLRTPASWCGSGRQQRARCRANVTRSAQRAFRERCRNGTVVTVPRSVGHPGRTCDSMESNSVECLRAGSEKLGSESRMYMVVSVV
jgi:hypothetical protein